MKLKQRITNLVDGISAKLFDLKGWTAAEFSEMYDSLQSVVDTIVQVDEEKIPHTALNDYEQLDNEEVISINQLLINFYQNVIEDGGTIEHYLSVGDFISGTENQGNIIRNIQIADGKIEKIELDFIKESEVPPIPASKVIGLNIWTTKEW